MPSKPLVALSSPPALGATSLGVSANLLALAGTGTLLLDRIRTADAVARATVRASPLAAANVTSAAATVAVAPRVAFVPCAVAPRPHVFAPRCVAPQARSPEKPVVAILARHAGVVTAARKRAAAKPTARLAVSDRSALRSEKVVVRPNDTHLALLSAEPRSLPYRTVASSGVVPRR